MGYLSFVSLLYLNSIFNILEIEPCDFCRNFQVVPHSHINSFLMKSTCKASLPLGGLPWNGLMYEHFSDSI